MEFDEEVLHGGVANAGAVVRVGDEVRRPAGPHAATIDALLHHLREAGFTGAPEKLGLDDQGRERLVFIPGDVPCPPYPPWSLTDQALATTAALMRRYHDATVGFVPPRDATWSNELADPASEAEVICHNDVCPENVVFRDGAAVALLDFDFAAPGRRVYDLASFARMCVPIDTPEDAARSGRGGLDPFTRLRVVADSYGVKGNRHELVDVLAAQLATAGAFVRRHVEAGHPAFIQMWEEMGGEARYDRRRRWFDDHRDQFLAALG